ncbi:MAG: hypothetical protein NT051_02920, partial [Candidatus Micrarchaeota archaeon]|nr:hypothetical protein [Candidatus Micrarchaeota archaeon]
IGAKKNGNEFAINGITLGLQIPTKKCGIPFDTRMAYDPKGKTINASLYWTLPQGNGKPKANATRMLPQKIIR